MTITVITVLNRKGATMYGPMISWMYLLARSSQAKERGSKGPASRKQKDLVLLPVTSLQELSLSGFEMPPEQAESRF